MALWESHEDNLDVCMTCLDHLSINVRSNVPFVQFSQIYKRHPDEKTSRQIGAR